MDRSLHFNVKSVFVMIEFKVCIVWHEYCYFSFLLISICMVRADSFEKTLMLGKIEGRRRRGRQRMRWLDGITDLMDMGLGRLWNWWWTGRPGMLRFMGLQRVGHDWVTELNWTDVSIWRKDRDSVYTTGEITFKYIQFSNYLCTTRKLCSQKYPYMLMAS